MRCFLRFLLMSPLPVAAQLDTTLVELAQPVYCGNFLMGLTAQEWEDIRPVTLTEVQDYEVAASRPDRTDADLARLVTAYLEVRSRNESGPAGTAHVDDLLDSLATAGPEGPESAEALAGVRRAQALLAYGAGRHEEALRRIEQSRAAGYPDSEDLDFDYLVARMALNAFSETARRPRAEWGEETYGPLWLAVHLLRQVEGRAHDQAIRTLDRLERFLPTSAELESLGVEEGSTVVVTMLEREWEALTAVRPPNQ